MSDGYQKQRLTEYLNGAREGAIGSAGSDWRARGRMLEAVSEALMKKGPELAKKLGTTSRTAEELQNSLLKSAQSMNDTGSKLQQAGDALVVVGDNLEKARVSRKAMKSLVEPPPYTAPSYNGVQPTPEQIQQDANARGASNQEHGSYQSAHAGQEAEAAEITANLDQAFLSAIPAMVAIHGGPDPTAPTGGKDGPGTSAPPPTNRTTSKPGVKRTYSIFSDNDAETDAERREREREERERQREREEREKERREREDRLREERMREERERLERERLERERLEREGLERERLKVTENGYRTPEPTTNVKGGTDSGASYHVVTDDSSAPSSLGSTSAGVGGAAAAGAAGAGLGAGAMKGGAVGGSAAAPVGGTVRGIGAGGQAGAASSISRSSTAAGARGVASGGTGTASRGSAAAGGSASRSAGAGGRAGAAGSSSRGAAAGSSSASRGTAAGRGAAGGGSAGRAGAGGATSGKGSSKGRSKGLFRRGSNGSMSGGRSNKSDEDRDTQRDALVYEQDWLGDETAAPGVLD